MFDLMKRKNKPGKVATFEDNLNRLMGRRLIEDPFYPLGNPFKTDSLWPQLDISETDTEIIVEAEVPGMDKKDIHLTLQDQFLTIKGEKKDRKEKSKKGYFRVERSYGYFHRNVKLPGEVDGSEVSAKYHKGVLKVSLKKRKPDTFKTIRVNQ